MSARKMRLQDPARPLGGLCQERPEIQEFLPAAVFCLPMVRRGASNSSLRGAVRACPETSDFSIPWTAVVRAMRRRCKREQRRNYEKCGKQLTTFLPPSTARKESLGTQEPHAKSGLKQLSPSKGCQLSHCPQRDSRQILQRGLTVALPPTSRGLSAGTCQ